MPNLVGFFILEIMKELNKEQGQLIKKASGRLKDTCFEDFNKLGNEIEEAFPELFKPKLEVGKWYKNTFFGKSLFCVTEIKEDGWYNACGFDHTGCWDSGNWGRINNSNREEATKEEVEQRLIEEAKRRGFKVGVTVVNVDDEDRVREIGILYGFDWDTDFENGLTYDSELIFKDGKWAEIIPERKGIPVHEMKDGEIGRIVEWGNLNSETGTVIRRKGSIFTVVNVPFDDSYCTIPLSSNDYRVELLKEGDTITIINY